MRDAAQAAGDPERRRGRALSRSGAVAEGDHGADNRLCHGTGCLGKVLVPTLAKGDIVILDNLGSHEDKPCAGPSGPDARTYCALKSRDVVRGCEGGDCEGGDHHQDGEHTRGESLHKKQD